MRMLKTRNEQTREKKLTNKWYQNYCYKYERKLAEATEKKQKGKG